MPSAVELAHRVAAGDVDQCALDWLREGLARHLAGEPLDQALRLDRASRLRARDQALRQAAAALGECSSTWSCAVALAAAVRRFESRVLPKMYPGSDLPPLDQALAEAFAMGVRVPATERALFDLLRL